MVAATSLELGNDEVYYQAYALHLQWNYFDHPPMVALLIRLSTLNLFFHHEFFIRLGPVICAALGTWLIFKTGCLLRSPRTGWMAAFLYNTSFYTSIIAGTFILPDSFHVLCWMLSIYLMVRILKLEQSGKSASFLFVLLGISIGICIMSKVQGVFLWLGFGAYILFHRRELLKMPMLWLSGVISLAIISPIYWWNLANHFITYRYHGSRIGLLGKPDLDDLLQQVLGSIFYNNPVNVVLYAVTLIALIRKKFKQPPAFFPLLLWLSLPLIGILLWASLFSETLPHWSGPAYLSLMLLAAGWLDEETDRPYPSRWLKSAAWVYGVVLILGVFSIRLLPLRLGSGEERNLGTGDPTLDMTGWKSFATQFDSLYREDTDSHKMKPGSIILSDYWFPAGHLDHYVARPNHQNLLVAGPLNNIHHFAWLNQQRSRLVPGSDAYFIYPSNYYGPPNPDLRMAFGRVEDSLIIPQYRSGTRVRNFIIYRMHDFKGDSLEYLVPGIR